MAYRYLILDSRGEPVAHAKSRDSLDKPVCRLELREQDVGKVLDHEYIRLVSMSGSTAATEARVMRASGDQVTVETVRTLGEEVRRNLRIPVRFESFLYPVSGSWKGRAQVVSHDLSCGGVSFFCSRPLEQGEVAQIVVPVTSEPLLLNLRILRERPSPEEGTLYAAEFTHMVHEEETMVREAVFSLQLRQARQPQ